MNKISFKGNKNNSCLKWLLKLFSTPNISSVFSWTFFLDTLESTQWAPRYPCRDLRGKWSPLLPLEARPDSPGESGMETRDLCLPLRGILGPGHLLFLIWRRRKPCLWVRVELRSAFPGTPDAWGSVSSVCSHTTFWGGDGSFHILTPAERRLWSQVIRWQECSQESVRLNAS